MHDDPIAVRRNFRLIFADITLFLGGFVLLDSATILPVFLQTLTSSPALIGLITAIRPVCTFIPQLWGANRVRKQTKQKEFVVRMAAISRVAITLFALTLMLAHSHQKWLMLTAFLIVYALLWLSEGSVQVAWTELVAKTIPERLRGRLFGNTQVAGGALGLLMGLFSLWVLSNRAIGYPLGYGILFGASAVLMWGSLASLVYVSESAEAADEDSNPIMGYVGRMWGILRTDGRLRLFLAVQTVIQAFSMSVPFYVLYAKKLSHIAGREVGILLTTQVVGCIVLSGIIGYVSDHYGPKRAMVGTLLCGLAAPLVALEIPPSSFGWWMLVFFFVGGVNGSAWIGTTNYLLETAVPEERKAYLCIMYLAIGPTALFPAIGGLIVQNYSSPVNFAATAVLMLVGLILSLTLSSNRSSSRTADRSVC